MDLMNPFISDGVYVLGIWWCCGLGSNSTVFNSAAFFLAASSSKSMPIFKRTGHEKGLQLKPKYCTTLFFCQWLIGIRGVYSFIFLLKLIKLRLSSSSRSCKIIAVNWLNSEDVLGLDFFFLSHLHFRISMLTMVRSPQKHYLSPSLMIRIGTLPSC